MSTLLRLLPLLYVLLLTWIRKGEAEPIDGSEEKIEKDGVVEKQPSQYRITDLAQSIKSKLESREDPEDEEIRTQYWRKTFEDIKKLSNLISEKEPPLLSRWKQRLDQDQGPVVSDTKVLPNMTSSVDAVQSAEEESLLKEGSSNPRVVQIPRFEGFLNWERMLQEWADEVQEYIQEVERESGSEYMLANYGRPLLYNSEGSKSNFSMDLDAEDEEDTDMLTVQPYVSDFEDDATELSEKTETRIGEMSERESYVSGQQIVPSPLPNGELALPHTDLSDKSKRIEIVTTASLPWRTGTAVNPLLRAAYMLEGRKEMGGSVTLMLPWLERRADQERVYGVGNTFETSKDQEDYIRTWLRESAGMPEASENLGIRWYTAWQNKAENSIYSMGDITALIPADEVDICILEEPEHLVSTKEGYL